MESSHYTSVQWKRVCDVSSQLLDSPADDWEVILARECGADLELRTSVLSVCGSYSETDELFGVAVHSPLALEDSLIGQRIGPWEILSCSRRFHAERRRLLPHRLVVAVVSGQLSIICARLAS